MYSWPDNLITAYDAFNHINYYSPARSTPTESQSIGKLLLNQDRLLPMSDDENDNIRIYDNMMMVLSYYHQSNWEGACVHCLFFCFFMIVFMMT